jgi:hypothetical protein
VTKKKAAKKTATVPKPDAKEALNTWDSMLAYVKQADEAELWSLLGDERNGQRRANFMIRIYGRAQLLRSERERRELFA